MSAPESYNQQGAAFRPPLLGLKDVTKLCDAAMHLFDVMYAIELAAKKANKARLATGLDRLDLISPDEHYADHEDYAPGRGEQ